MFALLASIPVAILGIIPYAVIAELAQLDSLKTGLGKEGMYFAVRNFFYKLGMTAGIMIFTILTLWGKDPGDDLGIRLNGIVGFIFCYVQQKRRKTKFGKTGLILNVVGGILNIAWWFVLVNYIAPLIEQQLQGQNFPS